MIFYWLQTHEVEFKFQPGYITFVEIDHEIHVLSTAIIHLPLIREGQMAVTGNVSVINRLGSLCLVRNSANRLIGRFDMTI